MKKMKKVLAVILSLAMVLGMSLTSFAEDHKPVSTDEAVVTVNGVAAGATVKAFKIAEGKWNDQGFIGYEALEVGGVKIADVSAPTAAEITEIARKVDKNSGIELEDNNGVYTKSLEVGEYLILVTANGTNDTTIYNPMVVSVYYSTEKSGDKNDAIGGVVSANDNFIVDGEVAYAKHEVPTIDKNIVDPGSENSKGDDTAFNDTVKFKVDTKFPTYSDAYTSADFNIIDTVSKGLTLDPASVAITVDGKTAVKDTDYTVELVDRTMTITFTNTEDNRYVLDNRGASVVVTYNATLNENAGINFDKNTNTVKAEYTNNPTTNEKGETEEKKTYHYTFGIDAEINGSGSTITKEVYKINENGKVEIVEVETDNVKVEGPLPGATFELRKKSDGSVVRTVVSDANGALVMKGLDAGEYQLVETKAPEGYSLDATVHTIVITASYQDDGLLKDYTVTVDEQDSTYKATYTSEKEVETIVYDKVSSLGIKNTKIAQLPSTGGIGTTIFTIGGCAIMIIAAALFFASRRRAVK